MGIISSLSHGVNMRSSLVSPFYARKPLLYPFLCDLYSYVLIAGGGASYRVGIAVPTVFLYISVYFSLYQLAKSLTKQRFIPEFAIVLYIFAGGTGWKYQLDEKYLKNPNINAVHAHGPYYCFWIHPLVHFLMPQRNGLLSLPICTHIIVLFIEKNFILAGILHGLLPMAAAHSYIAIGEYAIAMFIIFFPFQKFQKKILNYFLDWASYGFFAIGLAIPQVVYLSSSKRKMFSFYPIWLETFKDPYIAAFKLWWVSLGPFVAFSVFSVWTKLSLTQKQIYIPSLFVFMVSCFVVYQPGAMDNTKVFFVGWLNVASVVVALYIMKMFQHTQNIVISTILVLVSISMLFSATFCIAKALFIPFEMFSTNLRDFGLWISNSTRPSDAFLSAPIHCSPMMSFGGRAVGLGYGGWVYSHGLDLGEREREQSNLIRDRENTFRFSELGYFYALARPRDEQHNYNFSPPPVGSRWIKVITVDEITLYKFIDADS